ncbi:hypothetical protein ACPF8X_07790, partial [Streptomyces sp. G35A]
MSTAARSPVSLAVVSAGVGHPCPTRLLADRVTEAVCRSLAVGGARAEVEVVEPHRLAADLAQHTSRGRAGLDLREAVVAAVAADGLVVATPVLAVSPAAGAQQQLPPAATRPHAGDAQAPDRRARRPRAHDRRRR